MPANAGIQPLLRCCRQRQNLVVVRVEISPVGIRFVYKIHLPVSFPPLQPLLSLYGLISTSVDLVVDQLVDRVPLCEAIVLVILVFPNSFFEDIGHPTVEGTILLAGHEVEIVLPHSGLLGAFRSGYPWITSNVVTVAS